mmetsp:Transcript_24107/g.42670  ORF Transcript_24107/g.42670 Transcript_24107/m.42670 type:complete len:276 (-) Transcript_24107:1882-2709(-)
MSLATPTKPMRANWRTPRSIHTIYIANHNSVTIEVSFFILKTYTLGYLCVFNDSSNAIMQEMYQVRKLDNCSESSKSLFESRPLSLEKHRLPQNAVVWAIGTHLLSIFPHHMRGTVKPAIHILVSPDPHFRSFHAQSRAVETIQSHGALHPSPSPAPHTRAWAIRLHQRGPLGLRAKRTARVMSRRWGARSVPVGLHDVRALRLIVILGADVSSRNFLLAAVSLEFDDVFGTLGSVEHHVKNLGVVPLFVASVPRHNLFAPLSKHQTSHGLRRRC